MIIKPEDCAAAGFCVRGQKRFFRSHGLDFDDYWKNGIDESKLAGIEDSNMDRAKEIAREREG